MKRFSLNNCLKKFPVLFLMLSNASFATQSQLPSKGKGQQLSQETRKDLLKAMHGEAFANAKYLLYAQQALKEGNEDLAKLFANTAYMERLEHFRELAELYGLVGPSKDNLEAAIAGEVYEATNMYIEFARKADAAGDHKVAARFRGFPKTIPMI